jgi:recombination protein RecT
MTDIRNAVATRDASPMGLIEQYRGDIGTVLPSHIKTDTWVRVAVGAVRRDPKLVEAANNDPGAFMVAVMEAAQKGLTPGTNEYYLTVRKERGVKKIKGIEGYQGIIERIYRAGAAQSVVVEAVRENDDFTYVPGQHDRPVHKVDWFGGDRGALVGVYAYAVMQGGATSKVVVLNKAKVMEARAKSDGAHSDYSPWNQGDGEAMWLKTAARRLEKWVPTSNEYRKEQLRAALDVHDERQAPPVQQQPPTQQSVDTDTGEIVDGEIVDDAEPAPDEPTATPAAGEDPWAEPS